MWIQQVASAILLLNSQRKEIESNVLTIRAQMQSDNLVCVHQLPVVENV